MALSGAEDIPALPDYGLVETMVAARRLASQAQAVEVAAVAELARRRFAEGSEERVGVLSAADYLHDEVAQALTLTATSADDLIRFSTDLVERLPGTLAALREGIIDHGKARTIWRGTHQLAAVIETKVLSRAQAQTTGEIRVKIRRLVKRLDPDALARRRTAAERQRGVRLVETDDGTAHLSGVDLPADTASAAYGRISAIAAGFKSGGDGRGIDQLRADVFVGLLRGTLTTSQPPAVPQPEPLTAGPRTAGRSPGATTTTHDTTRPGTDGVGSAREAIQPGSAGAVATHGGIRPRVDGMGAAQSDAVGAPAEYGRFGVGPVRVDWSGVDDGVADVIAEAARAELSAFADRLPGRHHNLGVLIDHAGELIGRSLTGMKARWCVPEHDRTGYRPSAAIRRLIEHRDRRCCYPGVPPAGTTLRRRPYGPVPAGRTDLPLQRRDAVPPPPQGEADPRMANAPSLARRHSLDHPYRALEHHRARGSRMKCVRPTCLRSPKVTSMRW